MGLTFARSSLWLLSLAAVTFMGVSVRAQGLVETEENPRNNYIGIGGNIGLTGDETPLGEGGFAIVSKLGLGDRLALRNALIIEDDTASTIALTYNLPTVNFARGRVRAIPFVGGGILLQTSDDFEVDALISGGVDVPISPDFTGTVRVNVGFPDDDTDVGLLLGVGYNFRSPF